MRGDKEKKCLDFVKSNIKFENYYGFSQEDIAEFKECLNSATPNEKSSEFPDFICNNGFIEHFQISSGKITRKGSKHLEEFNKYQSKNEKKLFENMDNGNCSPLYATMQYSSHTYEYLKSSFKKSWEMHLLSLEKYNGNSTLGIYMIEYKDACIEMIENIYANVKEGINYGNLKEQIRIDHYSLCHDKDLLNYMYEYKNRIHYIIYVYNKGIEIINVENIPDLLKLLPYDYCIAGNVATVRMDTYIPIPNIEEK